MLFITNVQNRRIKRKFINEEHYVMNMHRVTMSVLMGVFLIQISAPYASAATDLEYPELVVSPRASERLEMESKEEPKRRWTTHLPVQASALATLTAGLFQLGFVDDAKDPSNYSALTGISVGAAWLIGTYFIGAHYKPYQSGNEKIAALAKKTPRERLIAERLAEEEIAAAASTGRKLAYASILTNLGASIYMISQAESKAVAGISAALSLAPFFFRYHWGTVAHQQQEYKKKIYGPIASISTTPTLLPDFANQRLVPGFAMQLAF